MSSVKPFLFLVVSKFACSRMTISLFQFSHSSKFFGIQGASVFNPDFGIQVSRYSSSEPS
jgi:hypothetical protein